MAADRMGGTLQPGDILNNTYVIEHLIAIGGTGEVYRARNRAAGREIAIKILRREFASNETFLDLMRREAAVLHEVQDDAVVRYYDILHSDLHGGFIFLVMEYIRGEPLADRMKRGPIDEATCLTIARRIAQGLKASHEKKALHRDLSPDNVILRNGDPERAVLIDFGIAKDVSEDARTVIGGGFAGKYQYAAPEQIDGHADGRSDLYSLGMTLIGAFRGQAPASGASYLEIIRAKSEKPDISDLPGRLNALVAKLTDPEPEKRLQSPDAVLRFLGAGPADASNADAAPRSTPAAVPPPPLASRRSSGIGLVLVLFVLLAGLAGGGWYFGLGSGRTLIFGPERPLADPYRMEILMAGPGRMRVSGHAPSDEAVAAALTALTSLNDGALPEGGIEAADGVPHPEWPSAVIAMARAASSMKIWWIYVEGLQAEIAGEVQNEAVRSAVLDAARTAALEAGITLRDSIEVVAPPLQIDALSVSVNAFATCGPLTVGGGTDGVLADGDAVIVSGRIGRAEEETLLRNAIEPLLAGRPLTLALEVVNPPVCRILALLPTNPVPGLGFRYGFGRKPGLARADTYRVAENPVIDLLIPQDVTGFLHVFYADNAASVYHFLPHSERLANALSTIGTVDEAGTRVVRLTFPADESTNQNVGFDVQSTDLGKNVVVAVVTPAPLFDSLRPFGEGLALFLEDLAPALRRADAAASWRFLVTAQPP
ncbi:MAG: serine/threonine-protein kinase [Pseudomonadota bacterium]